MSKIPKKSKAPSSFFLADEAGHNEKIQQLENAQQSDENQTGNDESAANDSAKKGDV